MKEQEITETTKQTVLERQHNMSISGVYLRRGEVNFHHFISKGARGVGHEWNIVALTPLEHRQLHDGAKITVNGSPRYTNEEFKTLIRNHLILNYLNWSESNCRFKKGKKKEDYGVVRVSKSKRPTTASPKRQKGNNGESSTSKNEL